MPHYQVQINGQNFLVNMEGKLAKHGFITWRYVVADNPEEGELASMQKLRETQILRDIVKNDPSDPPEMVMMEMLEYEDFEGIDDLEPGFIWYREKKWWQFWKRS